MNNQINLSVKDYQIIKNANLSFLPGLNCIIGQSNNGKSALMRASKACIYNEAGTTSVRTGCSNYAVGIQMNGHTVILQKGANSLYKIDNELFGKIGRTQLPEVAKALGITELNLNGSNETINFWDQMEKPFLLDRSETELFRFIVDSGKDNNVTTALKTLTQDRQQITKNISLIEGKIAQVDETLKRQEQQLDGVDAKIAICNEVIELGPKITRLNELTDLKNKITVESNELNTIKSKYEANLETYTKIEWDVELLKAAIKKSEILNKFATGISVAQTDITLLTSKLNKLKSLEVSDLNERFSKYKLLSEMISKLQGYQGEIQRLSSLEFKEVNVDFSDDLEKYKKICELTNHINSIYFDFNGYQELHHNIVKEIEATKSRIDEIGICPTCGQPFHN